MEIPQFVFVLVDENKKIDSIFYEHAAALAQAKSIAEDLDIVMLPVVDADDIIGFDGERELIRRAAVYISRAAEGDNDFRCERAAGMTGVILVDRLMGLIGARRPDA